MANSKKSLTQKHIEKDLIRSMQLMTMKRSKEDFRELFNYLYVSTIEHNELKSGDVEQYSCLYLDVLKLIDYLYENYDLSKV